MDSQLYEVARREFFAIYQRVPSTLEILDFIVGQALSGYLEAGWLKGQVTAHMRQLIATYRP